MNHGELIHNEKSEKICSKKEITEYQKEIAEGFNVTQSAVAFSYTELPSFEKIIENYIIQTKKK